jgi:hypothetical protein
VPSFAVLVPNDELLKKTLARCTGEWVSFEVTLPVMLTVCAMVKTGQRKHNTINRANRILNLTLDFLNR